MSQQKPERKPEEIPPEIMASAYGFGRRTMLVSASGLALAWFGIPLIRTSLFPRAPVFIAGNQRYDGPIEQTIRDGLLATGLDHRLLRGRRVLLKPNMVEPMRQSPQMTTHPNVVRATVEVFRRWDAHVVVGEAPGHVRDTEWALVESGIWDVLEADSIEFADLNYEEVGWVENKGKLCRLPGFHFPRSVIEADLVVSLPKMKTHHWVGVTLGMKNLYGTLPGIKYGWPKNVLHHAGIPETVVDINCSLPRSITIVDGILAMEGDGPILGTPKPMGILAISTQPIAVDATCARIMGVNPHKVKYLQKASRFFGSLDDTMIQQCGDRWQQFVSPFEMLKLPHLNDLKAAPGELIS